MNAGSGAARGGDLRRSSWRSQEAERLEARVVDLEVHLANLGDLEELLDALGEGHTAGEVRAAASAVRIVRNDRRAEARELRREPDVDVLPLALTTRTVRP